MWHMSKKYINSCSCSHFTDGVTFVCLVVVQYLHFHCLPALLTKTGFVYRISWLMGVVWLVWKSWLTLWHHNFHTLENLLFYVVCTWSETWYILSFSTTAINQAGVMKMLCLLTYCVEDELFQNSHFVVKK